MKNCRSTRKDTRGSSRRTSRRTAIVVGALAASSLVVGMTATSASAMTMAQWRAACLDSGGEWDAYRSYGALQYDCIWVTSSGYSIDTYRGGRFVKTCGATRGDRELCDSI